MIQAPQALRVRDAQTMLYEPADRGMNRRIRDWRGARVWIIGASTGIGAETAKLLLEKGAHVAISARKADALQQIADVHPQALVLPLDVTQHAQVTAARDQLLAQWGGLDLMLIVAGAYNEMRVDTFDMAVANQLLDINLRGVFHCIDAMLPITAVAGSASCHRSLAIRVYPRRWCMARPRRL
jgi:NADP-dependent 3-hydroxy acid dehydrogenase YdfG